MSHINPRIRAEREALPDPEGLGYLIADSREVAYQIRETTARILRAFAEETSIPLHVLESGPTAELAEQAAREAVAQDWITRRHAAVLAGFARLAAEGGQRGCLGHPPVIWRDPLGEEWSGRTRLASPETLATMRADLLGDGSP